jgi:hypothetical protein
MSPTLDTMAQRGTSTMPTWVNGRLAGWTLRAVAVNSPSGGIWLSDSGSLHSTGRYWTSTHIFPLTLHVRQWAWFVFQCRAGATIEHRCFGGTIGGGHRGLWMSLCPFFWARAPLFLSERLSTYPLCNHPFEEIANLNSYRKYFSTPFLTPSK